MKYIRVIEDSEEYITTRENLHDHILELQDSGFDFEGGIIKEADTIEELCDEFVVIGYGNRNGKPCIVEGINGFQTIKRILADLPIYGAIWTDKGLIYVAKMNDKGELELL